MLLLALGCSIDNDVQGGEKPFGQEDTEDTFVPTTETAGDTDVPVEEECNGLDDDGDGEVDEGFADENANGIADCLEFQCPEMDLAPAASVEADPTCEAAPYPIVDAFDARVLWSILSPTGEPSLTGSGSAPLVANLTDDNGDGGIDGDDDPEVIITAFPSMNYLDGGLVVLDGKTGADVWIATGVSGVGTPAVGDLDGDGVPEIVTIRPDGTTTAFRADGAELWTSVATTSNPYTPVVSIADLDADGQPEVLAMENVLDGATGALVLAMDAPKGVTAPVPVDIDQDGQMEIIMAPNVYNLDGSLRWVASGYQVLWAAPVQADADDAAEIAFIGDKYELYDDDGTLLHSGSTGAFTPGPPCGGDFDGDGAMELAWSTGKALQVHELDGSQVWSVGITDNSGEVACTAFDLDVDGVVDILYGDETSVAFYDGKTGAKNWEYTDQMSGTIFEYPTVADVDHDDHAEILFVSSWQLPGEPVLTVLEHAGAGWPRSGPTWGVHDFSGRNVGADGSIPTVADPAWRTSGLFRGRPAVDDHLAPQLSVSIVDVCVADCTYGPVQVQVRVRNTGARDVAAGTPLTIYAEGDAGSVAVGTTILPAIPTGEALEGLVIELGAEAIAQSGYTAVIDDDGTGAEVVAECDETDNRDSWLDDLCP